jgi:Fe-S-cluster-containing dehydrogenase component
MKVAGSLLGLAATQAVLVKLSGSTVRDLLAQAAHATDPSTPYWGFVVDANKCIGCGRCVLACKLENRVPMLEHCFRTWIERYRITADREMLVDSPNGGMDGFVGLEGGEHDQEDGGDSPSPTEEDENGDGAAASEPSQEGEEEIIGGFFTPKLCNQCDNPPCVQVCPVGATYKTKDGVTLVDQERCIGCRYCIQACPYGARYMVPDVEVTPTGEVHVADKCTWCYHRIHRGALPACVEVCPVGARIFGDLNDPASSVNEILRDRQVAVLKADLGTRPKVYYIGLQEGVR